MRLSRLKGVFRRIIISNFSKSYLEEQLSRRRGECRQCGKCCELSFKCLCLTSSRKCATYFLWRPQHCKTFPIDQRDLDEVNGNCGYYFV